MRVRCEISDIDLYGDSDEPIDSVCARCARCGHEVETYGRSDASVRRSLVTMREECPKDESNFYVADEA
ncbi:MAG: hypothetical protein JNM56_16470 [Planctomycetia bacterium]|nr:hypothetical protein [Planctomycetia bacterium]